LDEPQLHINGKPYPVPTSFTLGECRMIQRITGRSVGEFGRALSTVAASEDADTLTALVWVVMHRENPAVTVEEIEQLDIVTAFEQPKPGEGEGEQPSPPGDAGEPAGTTQTLSPGSATVSPDAAESPPAPTHEPSGAPA
jgi:hypothetical protein